MKKYTCEFYVIVKKKTGLKNYNSPISIHVESENYRGKIEQYSDAFRSGKKYVSTPFGKFEKKSTSVRNGFIEELYELKKD